MPFAINMPPLRLILSPMCVCARIQINFSQKLIIFLMTCTSMQTHTHPKRNRVSHSTHTVDTKNTHTHLKKLTGRSGCLHPVERKLRRILQTGHLMDVSKLQKVLLDNIGHVTFHEAYERTGRIINITVSPGNDYEKPRLLNYLTSPNVSVRTDGMH
jgi:hypothetical protein